MLGANAAWKNWRQNPACVGDPYTITVILTLDEQLAGGSAMGKVALNRSANPLGMRI
jgi:hypothetical protein